MNHGGARMAGSIHVVEQETGNRKTAGTGTGKNELGLLDRGFWAPSRIRAVIWRGLTVLTCPCCIPIWLWVLSGTAFGALLSRNLFVTVALFLALFALFFWKAIRSYETGSDSPPKEDHNGTR